MWLWVIEIADLIVFIVQFCKPCLNKPVKNSKNDWIAHEKGSTCHSEHQLSHLLQALSYVQFVLLFHPAANSCEALLEKPSACCLCLIASKWLAEAVLWPLEDEACQLGLIGPLVIVEASGESPPTAPGVLDTHLNAQLKQFVSWSRLGWSRCLATTMEQVGGLCLPPFYLIGRCVKKVRVFL